MTFLLHIKYQTEKFNFQTKLCELKKKLKFTFYTNIKFNYVWRNSLRLVEGAFGWYLPRSFLENLMNLQFNLVFFCCKQEQNAQFKERNKIFRIKLDFSLKLELIWKDLFWFNCTFGASHQILLGQESCSTFMLLGFWLIVIRKCLEKGQWDEDKHKKKFFGWPCVFQKQPSINLLSDFHELNPWKEKKNTIFQRFLSCQSYKTLFQFKSPIFSLFHCPQKFRQAQLSLPKGIFYFILFNNSSIKISRYLNLFWERGK